MKLAKLVHFYMLVTLKYKKVVEKFVKPLFMMKNALLLNGHNYVVGAHWNCLHEAIPMCTNNIIMLLKLRKPI